MWRSIKLANVYFFYFVKLTPLDGVPYNPIIAKKKKKADHTVQKQTGQWLCHSPLKSDEYPYIWHRNEMCCHFKTLKTGSKKVHLQHVATVAPGVVLAVQTKSRNFATRTLQRWNCVLRKRSRAKISLLKNSHSHMMSLWVKFDRYSSFVLVSAQDECRSSSRAQEYTKTK